MLQLSQDHGKYKLKRDGVIFRKDLLLWAIFSHSSGFQGIVFFMKWAALSNTRRIRVEAGALIHRARENCPGSLVWVISC